MPFPKRRLIFVYCGAIFALPGSASLWLVRVVLESTGNYHCPVVAALLENGIFVSVVNSLRMKRFCSQSIRKVKTDQIDAMQIALYGLAYWQELQPTRLPENTYRELQLLARQYYQMTSLLIKSEG